MLSVVLVEMMPTVRPLRIEEVACRKTKLRVLSVSWGFETLDVLTKAGPDFIAHQPTDILQRVAELNGLPHLA